MKAIFYTNKSDSKKVDKTLLYLFESDIILKNASSLIMPIIDLQLKFEDGYVYEGIVDSNNDDIVDELENDLSIILNVKITDINYCYIPSLNRYYYVTNIILVTDSLFRLNLNEDDLASHPEFKELEAYITRNEFEYDSLLKDELFPFKWNKEISVYEPTMLYPVDEFKTTNLYKNCMISYCTTSIYGSVSSDYDISAYMLGANVATQYVSLSIDNLKRVASNVFSNNTALGYIKNIFIYPFDIDSDTDTFNNHVVIGGVDTTIDEGFSWPKYCFNKIMIADFDFGEFTSFRNFSPYRQYEMYIPYYGFLTLNPDDISDDSTIQVYYIINYESGEANVYVYNYTHEYMIFSAPVQIGVKVALSSTNARQLEDQRNALTLNTILNLAGATISVLGGALTGNAVAVAGGVMSGAKTIGNAITTANTMYQTSQSAINSASEGVFNPQKVYIKVTSLMPSDVDLPKYRSIYGAPLQKVKKLSTLTGYTVIGDIHLDNINATEDEKNRLYALLKDGIIL